MCCDGVIGVSVCGTACDGVIEVSVCGTDCDGVVMKLRCAAPVCGGVITKFRWRPVETYGLSLPVLNHQLLKFQGGSI